MWSECRFIVMAYDMGPSWGIGAVPMVHSTYRCW